MNKSVHYSSVSSNNGRGNQVKNKYQESHLARVQMIKQKLVQNKEKPKSLKEV